MQFRGLCDKNIAAMDTDAVPDPFVPTSEDLAGFWDMVYIQVSKRSDKCSSDKTVYRNKNIYQM